MRLTARMRLTLLYAGLIALSGSAVAALIILLTFPPIDLASGKVDVKSGAPLPQKATVIDRATEESLAGKVAARAELQSVDHRGGDQRRDVDPALRWGRLVGGRPGAAPGPGGFQHRPPPVRA